MESPDETTSLISAGKVRGTPVYNTEGQSLGEIYDVMIDKRSGRIAYALMSFGGFLGIGERYHPLPWNALKYDTRQEGYVVGISKEVLQGGPSVAANEEPAWADAEYADAASPLRCHPGLANLTSPCSRRVSDRQGQLPRGKEILAAL